MLSQKCFEAVILLLDPVALVDGITVYLFKAEDFLLKSFDVLLLALAMSPSLISNILPIGAFVLTAVLAGSALVFASLQACCQASGLYASLAGHL